MALDFGDAGLFDPIPPTNKHKSKKEEDDVNDNIHDNGWKDDNDDDFGGKGKVHFFSDNK